MTRQCKCVKTPPIRYEDLMPLLQAVRVGGLLLTKSEADVIARRILLVQVQRQEVEGK